MDDIFSDVKVRIAEILKQHKALFDPSDKIFQSVKKHIYNVSIPECRRDLIVMGKDYVIKELNGYKDACKEGYTNTSQLSKWHGKMPKNYCQYFPISDEEFEYSTFYRVHELLIEAIRLFKKPSHPQPIDESKTTRYTAKHYVLAYLIECNAKGESFPIGQKKELEKIGNNKMGAGKGNRFYKVFNEVVNKDINAENSLIEIGGENWRTIVKDLSNEPKTIEEYLQSKQL